MDNETFCRYSFAATIAFALLVLGGLIAAALVLGSPFAVAVALLAAAAAYMAQASFTFGNVRTGIAFRWLSVVLWLGAVLSLL